MKSCQSKREACPEKSKAGLQEMDTFEESSNKVEAIDLEVNAEETEAEVERQQLCNEQMNVDAVGSLEDRHMDIHLTVCRRRQRKKWTQQNSEVQQKLTATRKRILHRAVLALHKEYICKMPSMVNVTRKATITMTLVR
jgi:hypothetical protein